MNKLRLIIAREYMSIVGRKSFIIMTLGMPLLFLLIAAVPVGLAYLNDKGSDVQQIAVIDETGSIAPQVDWASLRAVNDDDGIGLKLLDLLVLLAVIELGFDPHAAADQKKDDAGDKQDVGKHAQDLTARTALVSLDVIRVGL